MNKIPLVLLLILLSGKLSSAQYFERVYPGQNLEKIGSLDNTLDSGFIICGTQNGGGGFLMKVSEYGDTEWTSRDSWNILQSAAVIQNDSGNFVVIGSCSSLHFDSEAIVAIYDASGDPITHFNIPPDDGWGSWGITIARSPDRTLQHYCYSVDGFTAANYSYLDNQDIIAGDMTIVGLNSISMDNNGNYYSAANLAFDMDSLGDWHDNVLILSSNNFLRNKYFYDTDFESAAINSDGGVVVAGLYDSLGTKFLRMMKFDMAANLLWENYISVSDLNSVNQVSQTSDGGYAILCSSEIGNGEHITFIKTDASGMQTWKREFYGNGETEPRNFVQLEDGYAILGSSLGDPHLIRTDSLGRTNTTSVSSLNSNSNQITIYPNPSSGLLYLSFEKSDTKFQDLTVMDLTGREVFHQQVTESTCQLNLSFLARGVYQIRFTASEAEPISGRFVIE